MNQPPDDFHNASTQDTNFPPQQRPGQVPNYPQRPQAPPNNYPQQNFPQQGPSGQPGPQGFPPQGPQSQPGLGPGQQGFPQQGPQSQPGFGPGQQGFPSRGPQSQPGFGPGPQSQPGFGPGPQGFPQQGPQSQPGQQNFLPQSQPGFGPGPQSQPGIGPGPQSHPGLGPGPQGFPQQGPQGQAPLNTPMGPAGQRGPGPQNLVSPEQLSPANFAQQRPSSFPPSIAPISQPGFSGAANPQQDQYPWSGNPSQGGGAGPLWQQQAQPNTPNNWPDLAQTQTAGAPKKSKLWLAIALVFLALVVIGGGTIVLFSRRGSNPTSASTAQSTSTTINGITPTATQPGKTATTTTSGTVHGINTPVQAGSDWVATITSVKETTSSLIKPNASNTYLEINLTLKNVSGNSLTLASVLEFILNDASGHRYNETAADTNIRRPPDGTVNSNQTLAAQIAYEVPLNQHTFKLTFAYGLRSNNGASIIWQFSA